MNDLHQGRWQLGFVVHRWRHVLWVVPVLAVLVVLGLHWEGLRWDRATAVVQLRPAGLSYPMGGTSSTSAKTFAGIGSLVTAPEVLRAVVKDMGLSGTWRTSEEEATERLGALVTCEVIPGTAQLEVKVSKIPAADSRAICEALLKHAQDAAAAQQYSKAVEDLNRWKEDLERARTQLEEIQAIWLHGSTRSGASWQAMRDKFNAQVQVRDQIHLRVISDEMNLKVLESPIFTLVAPHWPSRPAAHHVKRFLISAGWALGVSVMAAVVLAYLLEVMIPRRAGKHGESDTLFPADR